MTLEDQYIELLAIDMQKLIEAGHRGDRNAWQELAYIEKKHSTEFMQRVLKIISRNRIRRDYNIAT